MEMLVLCSWCLLIVSCCTAVGWTNYMRNRVVVVLSVAAAGAVTSACRLDLEEDAILHP